MPLQRLRLLFPPTLPVIGSGLMLGLGDASHTVGVCRLREAGLGLKAGWSLGFRTGLIVVGMVGIGCC